MADLLSLGLATIFTALVWLWARPGVEPEALGALLLLVALIPVGMIFLGHYPAAGVNVVQELRRGTLFQLAVFGVAAVLNLLDDSLTPLPFGAILLACICSVVALPLGRGLVRHLFARRHWWGMPAVILGAGRTAELVIRRLTENPGVGIKVLACFDDDSRKHGSRLAGIPVIGSLEDGARLQRELQASYAIVAMPGVEPAHLSGLMQRYAGAYPHVVVVPNMFGVATVDVGARDLAGVVALYQKQNLLLPHNRWVKRLIDALLMVPLGLLSLPIIGASALAVWLVDRANPFYSQRREGQGGKPINVWKIRTMRGDADAYLAKYLEQNPKARAEWEQHYKLTRDPRILPVVGNFLRRTSLDELPQLLNILRGEMSFVGPRPFPYYHLEQFEDEFRRLRASVTPGLTGYWQVTSRSSADLDKQQELDSYYIRNWSVWMDVYIIARTPWAVVFGEGAY